MTARTEIGEAEAVLGTAKPSVLLLTPHYLPGHKAGGPVVSIAAMVETLGEEFSFRIVTSDRDLGDESPYPGTPANRWAPQEKAEVMYLSKGFESWRVFLRALRRSNRSVLYLNGLLPRKFSMIPMLLRRLRLIRPLGVVVAPRGELYPGATNIKKLRKTLFFFLARVFSVYAGVIWHASSEQEAQHIRSRLRLNPDSGEVAQDDSIRVVVASDLALRPPPARTRREPKERGSVRLIWLSRVAREKNLHGALEMLRPLAGNVLFRIYGPVEDPGYLRMCRKIAESLPRHIDVEFRGPIPHSAVCEVLRENDVFFLPTFGENFCHAILEALCAGCPVVSSDQTPWQGLTEQGAGWQLPLDDSRRFTAALQSYVDMDPGEFRGFSELARSVGHEYLLSSKNVSDHRALLLEACMGRQGSEAGCIGGAVTCA